MAELPSGAVLYSKCPVGPFELVRAVFRRRLPSKTFDTLDVNLLTREPVPKKDLEALRASRSFFVL